MRELKFSFFLLFLLFISVDITTTFYSLGIRRGLFTEIDYRITEAVEMIRSADSRSNNIGIPRSKIFSVIIEQSLEWVKLYDSNKNEIFSSNAEVEYFPEFLSDTARFWGYRYGSFPYRDGYILVSASEEYLKGLKNLFRISLILRILIYITFTGLGIYMFRVFSMPFRTVEEAIGNENREVGYMIDKIREMAEDYKEKLKNLRKREKEFRRRVFLSRLGENVTQVLHEIRNSTGAIIGFSKLIDNDDVKHGILEEGERLKTFSTNLLSLAGPLRINREEIKAEEFLSSIIDRFEAESVKFNVDIGKDKSIYVDKEIFSRAIYNILENSIEACDDGGVIFVSIAEEAEWSIIRIRDNGCGMDEETKNSIFDLFFTKKDGGVGLGMVLAKRIIEAHDGEIEVKSEVNTGTEIIIKIPGDKYE